MKYHPFIQLRRIGPIIQALSVGQSVSRMPREHFTNRNWSVILDLFFENMQNYFDTFTEILVKYWGPTTTSSWRPSDLLDFVLYVLRALRPFALQESRPSIYYRWVRRLDDLTDVTLVSDDTFRRLY